MKTKQQKNMNHQLMRYYEKMLEHFGPRGWWPGETTLEICIGAILTQSVSWKNVAKALQNLKNKGLLDIDQLYQSPIEQIEQCIHPTLYYRMKAKKIKAFINHMVHHHEGCFEHLFGQSINQLREELLGIYGIGQETADSMILYAAEKPIFVVDAYTRRIFSRIGLFAEDITYHEMQQFFMNHLEADTPLYNEYHALIVGVGNGFCANKKPKCTFCPLEAYCHTVSNI